MCPRLLVVLLSLLAVSNAVLLNIFPFIRLILDGHNFRRATEGASNMRKLEWDQYLVSRAAQWTENCFWEHQRAGLGENLAYQWSTGFLDPGQVIRTSMDRWYEEKFQWRFSTHCGSACHYTQMIWANTARIGCALSRCPMMRIPRRRPLHNALYFACFYNPPGNYIGQLPFIPGPPCARCRPGERCDRGLCVAVV